MNRKKPQLSPLGKAVEHFQSSAPDGIMSAYKISRITGITEATISNLKNGKSSPSIDTLERIAKVLQVNASDILLKKESLTGSK
jgi:transcriptional regulator with XRE-family HTH domain